MSIVVVKDEGVTVITMLTDSESMLPRMCQILKALCYSPMCCSVNKGMMRNNIMSVLGALQVTVALFNFGLGPGRANMHYRDFAGLGTAYWLGAMFISAGIVTLISDWLPCACLVGFAVLLNIVGSIYACLGIVMYAIDISIISYDRYVEYDYKYLLIAMDATMITLVVLQLCVCICVSVLGTNALFKLRREEGGRDGEISQPLLKEVPLTSPGA